MTTAAVGHQVPGAPAGPARSFRNPARNGPAGPGRAQRAFGALAALVVVLAIGGLGYQAIAAEADRRVHPAPGRLVDAGGLRLHVRIAGEPAPDRPTVVLEAGLGGMSSNWAWIQPELAQETRVVSYDRAGLGWSESSGGPHDAHTLARQLRTALRSAGVEGPYVVVGHSLGGLFVRAFADLYADEVVGMVLLDSSHPDQWERFPGDGAAGLRQTSMLMDLMPVLARFGVPRALGLFHEQAAELPRPQADEARAFYSSVQHGEATRDEVRAWESMTSPQVRAAGPLRDIPVAVLSATEGTAADQRAAWLPMQAELAALSSRGTHQVVEGATHVSLVTNREHAMIAVAAIRGVIHAAPSRP
jgi:pimeloyl-ACP methyl ester carboxylesterase